MKLEKDTYIFDIKSNQDVLSMQLEIRNIDIVKNYIAIELAQNLVDSKHPGELYINGKVIGTIFEMEKNEVKILEEKIESARKKVNNNNSDLFEGIDTKKKNYGGFGLISILKMGWDIETEYDKEKKIKISAIKRTT